MGTELGAALIEALPNAQIVNDDGYWLDVDVYCSHGRGVVGRVLAVVSAARTFASLHGLRGPSFQIRVYLDREGVGK